MFQGVVDASKDTMYNQQRRTMLAGMGPMPIDPGPDLVCRMAAKSFAQARVQFDKDLNSGKHKGMAAMAWMKTMAQAHANGC